MGLTATEAAKATGINRATWTTAEKGQRVPQSYNRAAIERTLRWRPGSIDAILAGGEPAEAESVFDVGSDVALMEWTDERKAAILTEVDRIESLPVPAEVKQRMLSALVSILEEIIIEGASRAAV